MLTRLIAYLRGLALRRRVAHETDDELAFHLDQEIAAQRAKGLDEAQARRVALRDLGGLIQTREAVRDLRDTWIDSVWRDVRHATRSLRRTPVYTSAVLGTLAIVVGANSAVFGLGHALLWRPLPYPEPDRLVQLVTEFQTTEGPSTARNINGRMWAALHANVGSLDVAVVAGESSVNFNTDTRAAVVAQARVGAGYFGVLGVSPRVGREFLADEDRPGGPAVAVVSHGFWRRELDSDPHAVGRTIKLRGEAHQIVGVLPEQFVKPGEPADVFTPVRPSTQGEGGGANYRAIGRVRPGHTVVDASGEWAAIATAVIPASALPPGVTREFKAIPLQEVIVDEVRAPIELLLAVGLLVLVIACVNLPALALARSGSLRQQVAIRLALGSSRRAIVQQLVIENLILGGAGGALGVVVGTALLAGLKTLAADVYVIWAQANLDLRVVAGSIAVSTVTTAMAGLVPALRASRSSAARLIVSEDSRTVVGGPHQWWRRALVCIELALSVALLVITGLLTRTLVNLQTLDPGFEAKGLVATHVSLQDERYRTAERINQLFEQSLTDLARTPGVESAAVSLELPYHRLLNNFMRFTDREPSTTQPSMANLMYVSPSFFDTYRIPVRVGRTFADADRAGAPHVAVVNEAFVRSLADGIVPLGRRFAMGDGTEIVGVVGDVQARNSGFRWRGMVDGPLQAPPIVFLPAAQVSDGLFRLAHQWFEPYWTIRVAGVGNADAVLRRAIAKVDPLLPIQETMSLDDVRRSATASQRLLLVLVGTCAMVALLLTMIGVYGLMAQVVLERTREIAIRVSLGATIGRMIGRLTLIGATLAAVGTTVGLLLAWMNTRLVVSLLWGVDHRDPLTFAAIAVGLFMFATMASVVPALRALRIDPARTLRA